jgi:N6-adenosine-specific RNA methylase IME4
MSLSEHSDDRNAGDAAALVAEALRLEAAGKSQRQIAAALGKPRHWVRFTALAKPGPAIGMAAVEIDPQTRLEFHPLAEVFPLIEGAEFNDLVADIRANGQREDIVLLDGTVLDGRIGRNRYRACLAAGVAPRVIAFSPDGHGEPLAFVISKNLKRRHLNESQRAMAAARLANMRQGERTDIAEPSANLPKVAQPAAASMLNVSPRLVTSAKAVQDKGSPALVRAVDNGKISVSEAASATRLSRGQQDRVAEAAAAGRPKAVRAIVQDDRRAAHAARTLVGGTVDDLHRLAASGFKAAGILADPPWKFVTRSERGEGRSANQHYRTDALDLIKALPVAQLAAPDAVLCMWIVDWCLPQALEVIKAWGFEHKTTAFTWAKLNESGEGWHMGQGYWTRANPEDCWLATCGNPKRLYADVRQLIVAPVAEHSRKPNEIYERIERLVEGPYLELYARCERKGWMSWGDELPFKMPGEAA